MKIRTDIIAEALALIAAAVAVAALIICGNAKAEEPTEPTCEPTTLATIEETTEYITEPTQEETTVTEETVKLYDVPLEEDLQIHIIETAKAHDIDPAIIFGMAFKESTYRTDAIGDGGYSHGLLQVQSRFHQERMERLGCTDMLDPFQNVTVAVDFLAYLIGQYDGNVEMALVAYNMGMGGAYNNCFSKGVYTSGYSRAVMAKAAELAVIE